MNPNHITGEVIGAAIEVHRELGPGKVEMAYEQALVKELTLRGIPHQAQKAVAVVYKGVKLECGYRLDVLVANLLVVEAKSVEIVHPVNRAQIITYMKLGGWKLALLLNFNVALLKDGIDRLTLATNEGVQEGGTQTETLNSVDPFLHSVTGVNDEEAEHYANQVITPAIEVHRILGPGLLPSSYEICLCHELHLRGVGFECKRPLALSYKGAPLDVSDEITLLVGGRVVVKPRALFDIQPVHEAELLSQLRLGGWPIGLLLNFNSLRLADGLRRIVFTKARK